MIVSEPNYLGQDTEPSFAEVQAVMRAYQARYDFSVALLVDGNTVSTREGRELALKTVIDYHKK